MKVKRLLVTACLVCAAVALALTAPAPDLLVTPNARAADITFAAENQHPKGTVLVLRAGAWILGTVDNAVPDCRYFAARGYDAVAVDYPYKYFASLAAARSDAATARAKRLPVYAFGYSAGGNLAAMLAVRGDVTAAVDVAGPVNMVDWLMAQERACPIYPACLGLVSVHARRRASPYFRYSARLARPLLLMHSHADEVVPYAESRALAHKGGYRLMTLRGKHLTDATARRRGLQWLNARTRSCRPPPG
jgi:acetyl esterase/lipase